MVDERLRGVVERRVVAGGGVAAGALPVRRPRLRVRSRLLIGAVRGRRAALWPVPLPPARGRGAGPALLGREVGMSRSARRRLAGLGQVLRVGDVVLPRRASRKGVIADQAMALSRATAEQIQAAVGTAARTATGSAAWPSRRRLVRAIGLVLHQRAAARTVSRALDSGGLSCAPPPDREGQSQPRTAARASARRATAPLTGGAGLCETEALDDGVRLPAQYSDPGLEEDHAGQGDRLLVMPCPGSALSRLTRRPMTTVSRPWFVRQRVARGELRVVGVSSIVKPPSFERPLPAAISPLESVSTAASTGAGAGAQAAPAAPCLLRRGPRGRPGSCAPCPAAAIPGQAGSTVLVPAISGCLLSEKPRTRPQR